MYSIETMASTFLIINLGHTLKSFSTTDHCIQIEQPPGSPHSYCLLDSTLATIHCSGNLFAVDEATESFIVTVWQKIAGTIPLTGITIIAVQDHSYFYSPDDAMEDEQFWDVF
jgi:hypothetical protein